MRLADMIPANGKALAEIYWVIPYCPSEIGDKTRRIGREKRDILGSAK